MVTEKLSTGTAKAIDDENPFGLEYVSAPAVPASFTKRFNDLVPISPNGKDRLLRYVWGCDRFERIAGVKRRRYVDTVNDPPKYIGRACWVLEAWQSPDVFDRAEWESAKHILGEFPRNGVFDFLAYHETSDGGFRPLDESALNVVKEWAFWRGKGPKRSIEQLIKSMIARQELREAINKERGDAVATEFGEQVVKVFENQKEPVYSLPSTNGAYKETASGILIKK